MTAQILPDNGMPFVANIIPEEASFHNPLLDLELEIWFSEPIYNTYGDAAE